MSIKNIFQLPATVDGNRELFETLIKTRNIHIERIVSTGQVSPSGFWYDQKDDEWVTLLQGNATLEYDNGEKIELNPGDYLLIPTHQRHRITFTSEQPACIWIAIHGKLK